MILFTSHSLKNLLQTLQMKSSSNDAFGQHFCSEMLFNDLVNQYELNAEAIKYYGNILNPFSKLVTKKIDEIVALNLPVDFICPSHGIVWRENPVQIVTKYSEWAINYSENQIMAGLLEMVKGLKFKTKKAAAFGCFGWHDVSTKIIQDTLSESGFEIPMEPLRFIWSPDADALKLSIDYGRQFVTLLNKN